MNGFILAAGFGYRLRPLTDNLPKPAIRLKGEPLVNFSIAALVSAGVEELAINTHYLPDIVESCVNAGFGRFPLRFCREKEILGTGGGLKHAFSSIDSDGLCIMNSDIAIDVNIAKLQNFHHDNSNAVTMVLRPLTANLRVSPVYVDAGNMVKGIINRPAGNGRLEPYMFTGVQIVQNSILRFVPGSDDSAVKSSIITAYRKMIEAGEPVGAYIINGYWNDFGTLQSLHAAEKEKNSFIDERIEFIKKLKQKYGTRTKNMLN